MAQTVKKLPVMWEIWVQFLGQQDPLEKDRLPTPGFMGFPGGLGGKESACNVGDLDLIPGLGRSRGGRHGNPLQNTSSKRLRAKDNRSYQVQDSLLSGKRQGSQTNTWKTGFAYFYLYCCKGKVC